MNEKVLNYWIAKYYNTTNNLFTSNQKMFQTKRPAKANIQFRCTDHSELAELDIKQNSRY